MKTFKQFMEKLTPIGDILPDVVNQIGKAGDARSRYNQYKDDIMKLKASRIKKGKV